MPRITFEETAVYKLSKVDSGFFRVVGGDFHNSIILNHSNNSEVSTMIFENQYGEVEAKLIPHTMDLNVVPCDKFTIDIYGK